MVIARSNLSQKIHKDNFQNCFLEFSEFILIHIEDLIIPIYTESHYHFQCNNRATPNCLQIPGCIIQKHYLRTMHFDPKFNRISNKNTILLGVPFELGEKVRGWSAEQSVYLVYLVYLVVAGEEGGQSDEFEEDTPHRPHVHLQVIEAICQKTLGCTVPEMRKPSGLFCFTPQN